MTNLNNLADMGKNQIELDCKTHLASANSGATVMDKDDSDHGNVTVMGKNSVTKVNCQSL